MDTETEWQTVGAKRSSQKVKYTIDTNMDPKGKPVRIQPPKVSVPPAAAGPTSFLTKLKANGTSRKKYTLPSSILRKLSHPTGTIKESTLKPTPPSAPQAATYPKQMSTPARRPTLTPMAIDSSVDSNDSNLKQSAFRPLLNVPTTNNGTLRITIRWTPENKALSHSKQQGEWLRAALEMLHELFCDDQGVFYRWEIQDMATWTSPSNMTDDNIRDEISPNVTYVQSQGMFIFGVRFGFVTKNAHSWNGTESTTRTMRQRKVWATTSNLSSNSRNLVNAGYILMKAPNTTHKVRYLQSLRNQLPDNTFFDIVLAKRTPSEQSIIHLAIRCGENHVAALTKALSAILNGKEAAIFLPRVVLGKLSTEQITKYFVAYANYYVKSHRPICLSSMVTNLDTVHTEQFANGDQISRTTMEWATSLKLPSTGDSARCDIVNGGANLTANLLVPSLFFQEIVEEVSRYKLRINPLARCKARFRDNIPGLPEVIYISLSVQESLDCLKRMSSEDMWKQAPSAVRSPNSSDPAPAANKGVASSRSYASAISSQGTDDSSLTQKTNPPTKTGRPLENGLGLDPIPGFP